jgi:8-oxo-dGTP diphosphatase
MNSKLYNKYYKLPENVLNYISSKLDEYINVDTNGKKKANFLLSEKQITYQNLKKYKNFFDSYIKQNYNIDTEDDQITEKNSDIEFELSGGYLMKNFVEETLKNERFKVKEKKKIGTELGGMYNQYRKETPHDNLKVNTQRNFITESEVQEDKKTMVVGLVVIFNDSGKVLTVKRSNNTNWCPGCWAIVGGKIEKGELPEVGMIREVKEETGINLKKFKFKKLIKTKNIIEYLYLGIVDNDFVELNNEHTEYKWATIQDIKLLDNKVPNLLNYIKYVIL